MILTPALKDLPPGDHGFHMHAKNNCSAMQKDGKRHRKGQGVQNPGGIVEKEASVHLSNLMLVCGRCNKPTRVGARRLEDGRRTRVCRRCGELVD